MLSLHVVFTWKIEDIIARDKKSVERKIDAIISRHEIFLSQDPTFFSLLHRLAFERSERIDRDTLKVSNEPCLNVQFTELHRYILLFLDN